MAVAWAGASGDINMEWSSRQERAYRRVYASHASEGAGKDNTVLIKLSEESTLKRARWASPMAPALSVGSQAVRY